MIPPNFVDLRRLCLTLASQPLVSPDQINGSSERLAPRFRQSSPTKFTCQVVMFRGWFP